VPVLVQDDVNDRLSLEQAVVENLHRVDLHPLEEAAAYQQLIEDFDLTHEQVAQRVVRVGQMLRIHYDCSNSVRPPGRSGQLTDHGGHARSF